MRPPNIAVMLSAVVPRSSPETLEWVDRVMMRVSSGALTNTASEGKSENDGNDPRRRRPTKAGWCLREALCHVVTVDDGRIRPLVEQHGPPAFYLQSSHGSLDDSETATTMSTSPRHAATQDLKDPRTCFQSLVRTIAGQFVSGQSAQAAWQRLLDLAAPLGTLTPDTLLRLATETTDGPHPEEDGLQKRAGLTRAKTASMIHLAECFRDGVLSEDSLVEGTEDDVRRMLLQVKGIGPWSCDMFLMFYLERPNILPLGDLGVRKGLASYFGWRGAGKNQSLCEKRDATWIREQLQPYSPYQSLVTYYMWRANEKSPAVDSNRLLSSSSVTLSPVKIQSTSTPSTRASSPPTVTASTKDQRRKRRAEESTTPPRPARTKQSRKQDDCESPPSVPSTPQRRSPRSVINHAPLT